jgi:hypothetical protein
MHHIHGAATMAETAMCLCPLNDKSHLSLSLSLSLSPSLPPSLSLSLALSLSLSLSPPCSLCLSCARARTRALSRALSPFWSPQKGKKKKGPAIDVDPNTVFQHTGFRPNDLVLSPFGRFPRVQRLHISTCTCMHVIHACMHFSVGLCACV